MFQGFFIRSQNHIFCFQWGIPPFQSSKSLGGVFFDSLEKRAMKTQSSIFVPKDNDFTFHSAKSKKQKRFIITTGVQGRHAT
jgi:hypothetical protein